MSAHIQRKPCLAGRTYKVRLPQDSEPDNRARLYVTVNEQGGRAFEVFVRYDAPEPFEWVFAVSVLITRLLQAGVGLADIGRELQEIHSPATRHIMPGTSDWCPSLVARIGRTLERHAEGWHDVNAGARHLFDNHDYCDSTAGAYV